MSSIPSLLTLPEELIITVCPQDVMSLVRLSKTCHTLHRIAGEIVRDYALYLKAKAAIPWSPSLRSKMALYEILMQSYFALPKSERTPFQKLDLYLKENLSSFYTLFTAWVDQKIDDEKLKLHLSPVPPVNKSMTLSEMAIVQAKAIHLLLDYLTKS